MPVRVDRDVAELPAEAVRAAEQASAEDDASADADLAEDADEVVDADRCPRPVLGERCEIRLVLDVHSETEPRTELLGERDVSPAEVRGEDDGAGCLLDETGHRDRHADRPHPLARRRLERDPGGPCEPVEDRAGSRAAVVAIRPALVADGAGEILDRDGEVVDVDLEADPDDDVGELEADARPTDPPRRRRLPRLADQREVDELGDEARDGAAGETRVRGDLGRDRAPPTATCRRTTPRLARRTVVWSAGSVVPRSNVIG